jgi:hypothetical protein
MSRRTRLALILFAFVVALFGGVLVVVGILRERQRAAQEALNVGIQDFGAIFADGMKGMVSSNLNIDRIARLEGDVTSLTLTITNPGPRPMKDVVIEGITLDKAEPRERDRFPVRIPELAAGASHRLVLHFDQIRWIDDAVDVGRDDLSWAAKPLEFKASWVVSGGSQPVAGRPGVEMQVADSRMSTSSMGLLKLDPEDAKALKKRRDAGRKGP